MLAWLSYLERGSGSFDRRDADPGEAFQKVHGS
jgi:hypothetical protein